jgi:hypothetical protein
MDRITQAISDSKYSIHDLSRCRGEGDKNLARFNMPLELGVAMAHKFGLNGNDCHDWLLPPLPGKMSPLLFANPGA